jgi:hypothetical protein
MFFAYKFIFYHKLIFIMTVTVHECSIIWTKNGNTKVDGGAKENFSHFS